MLGGFFDRQFLYISANPFPRAILLAKATGRPVKLVWSREEEFLRDAVHPMAAARFRAAIGADGMPQAIEAVAISEGAAGRWFGRQPNKVDSSAVEGIAGKRYAIPDRRVGHIHVEDPAVIGFWRSVGHCQCRGRAEWTAASQPAFRENQARAVAGLRHGKWADQSSRRHARHHG